MSKIFKPPKASATISKLILDKELHAKLQIPPYILCSEAENWLDTKLLVDEYFVNNGVNALGSEAVYEELLKAFDTLSKTTEVTKTFNNYAKKLHKYFGQLIVKTAFTRIFKLRERKERKEESRVEVQEEIEISFNRLAAQSARDVASLALSPSRCRIGIKRTRQLAFEEEEEEDSNLENVELEDPFASAPVQPEHPSFIIERNRRSFEIHTPSTQYIISPNKPIIQNDDRILIDNHFDIRLSTDVAIKCSSNLNTEYLMHQRDMKKNASLREILGEDYNKLDRQLFGITLDNYGKEIFNIDHKPNLFMEFIKQSYNDLCNIWCDPGDYEGGGERTLFSEVFLQQFKLFAKKTKLVEFKWIEKKQSNIDHAWLVKRDYAKKDVQLKLLDGIGYLKKNKVNFLMIESSGINENIVEHTLEDTIKNLKHATDSLTNVLCDCRDCNINTVMKLNTLTAHVIKDKVTIIKYNHGKEKNKWSAVETRNTKVPLKWENRRESIKRYEMFAHIYLVILNQHDVYDQLENERLGITVVNEQDLLVNNDILQ